MYGAPCNSHSHIFSCNNVILCNYYSCTYDPISNCMDVQLGCHVYVHDGFSICMYMSRSMVVGFQWKNVNINIIYLFI
jgi:hypothetical protein